MRDKNDGGRELQTLLVALAHVAQEKSHSLIGWPYSKTACSLYLDFGDLFN